MDYADAPIPIQSNGLSYAMTEHVVGVGFDVLVFSSPLYLERSNRVTDQFQLWVKLA